jgi:hypothetical protein
MKSLLVLLLASSAVFAAVSGTVTNQTTGKPQPDASVTLVKLGQGMETVASVKTDAQGRFQIDKDLAAANPHLIQVLYQGVTYNKAIPPGAPSAGLSLDVFEASPKRGDAKVTQHMVLIEPSGTELTIGESIVFENQGKTTFNDPAGTLKFWLPPGANGQVRVSVNGPQGMPVSRPAEKTSQPNVYAVKYPVKPGETRFDLSYALPEKDPAMFEGKLLHGGGPLRIVAPRGVTLAGDNVKNLGPEPRTQASIYDVSGTEYKVAIQGTGSLRASAPAEGPSEDDMPKIDEAKPRIYDRLPAVLGLAGTILLLGFVMLYRSSTASSKKA